VRYGYFSCTAADDRRLWRKFLGLAGRTEREGVTPGTGICACCRVYNCLFPSSMVVIELARNHLKIV